MAFECDKSGATYDDALMKLRLFTALITHSLLPERMAD